MKCPWCDTDNQSNIISTRSRIFGVKRVRVCLACKRRFATIEITEMNDNAFKSLRESIRRFKTKERKKNEKV